MKIIIISLFSIFLLPSIDAYCQSSFNDAMQNISADLCAKLNEKGKKTVVVLYITDFNKSITVAGKYLADVLSVNIVNDRNNFQVFDRENLNSISEAKKLMDEGYIDVDLAKQLGKILSVEVIIVGNYTVLSNSMKLSLKALDSATGFLVAATMHDLPMDADANALLGIGGSSAASTSTGNRGFNSPLSSNERVNNPETVNKSCQEMNTGDFCFENTSKNNYFIEVFGGPGGGEARVSLEAGQSQCLYNKKAGVYKYSVLWKMPNGQNYHGYKMGEISIEVCQSKTFSLK